MKSILSYVFAPKRRYRCHGQDVLTLSGEGKIFKEIAEVLKISMNHHHIAYMNHALRSGLKRETRRTLSHSEAFSINSTISIDKRGIDLARGVTHVCCRMPCVWIDEDRGFRNVIVVEQGPQREHPGKPLSK
jgi:hypothetical protein